MEIFRSIDVNNRGFLTAADFIRLCLDLDIGLTAGQILSMFEQLDADNDGRINCDDFVRAHRTFSELFLAGVTSEESLDVTSGALAFKQFLIRRDVELGVLTCVRYEYFRRCSRLRSFCLRGE